MNKHHQYWTGSVFTSELSLEKSPHEWDSLVTMNPCSTSAGVMQCLHGSLPQGQGQDATKWQDRDTHQWVGSLRPTKQWEGCSHSRWVLEWSYSAMNLDWMMRSELNEQVNVSCENGVNAIVWKWNNQDAIVWRWNKQDVKNQRFFLMMNVSGCQVCINVSPIGGFDLRWFKIWLCEKPSAGTCAILHMKESIMCMCDIFSPLVALR